MSKGEYIPASELGDFESERVIWRLNLPNYAPAENIGVNVGRLDRIARLAGFESLRIGTYAGDVTSVKPEIDGVGNDGSVTASMSTTVSKAETQKISVEPEGESIEEYTWTNGQVSLNMAEIDNRVGEKGVNLRDPKQWAKEINAAMRQGINNVARNNIIERPTLRSKLRVPAYLVICWASLDVMGLDKPDNLPELLAFVAEYQFIADPIACGVINNNSPKDRKWSAVPGVQLDRLAAIKGLARVHPLVKKIDDK